ISRIEKDDLKYKLEETERKLDEETARARAGDGNSSKLRTHHKDAHHLASLSLNTVGRPPSTPARQPPSQDRPRSPSRTRTSQQGVDYPPALPGHVSNGRGISPGNRLSTPPPGRVHPMPATQSTPATHGEAAVYTGWSLSQRATTEDCEETSSSRNIKSTLSVCSSSSARANMARRSPLGSSSVTPVVDAGAGNGDAGG
ncbi:unnamed protein product, partial [Laminaria digitata]